MMPICGAMSRNKLVVVVGIVVDAIVDNDSVVEKMILRVMFVLLLHEHRRSIHN